MTHNYFLNCFKKPNQPLNPIQYNSEDIFSLSRIANQVVYLDYASSTPVDLRVYEKMTPYFLDFYGNSSKSLHLQGEISKNALEKSREQIAQIIGVDSDEVIFTSSATEGNNLLLRGLLESPYQKRKKIITCVTEHSSIANTAKILSENLGKRLGFEFYELSVDKNGQIPLEQARKLIDDKTLCVCVMDVNNETGIVQNSLVEIEKLTHAVGAYLHVDIVQGFARHEQIALNVNFDSAVISSSKIYGPKGAAAFILKKRRPKIKLEPQLTGGGQEFGLRSSTTNVACIVGFAHACALQKQESSQRIEHYTCLENAFIHELQNNIDACFYGLNTTKIKGILSLSIPNVNAMKLLENTNNVCASVGSGCKTLQATASHVILSLGVDLEQALASFRVSFGLNQTEEEVRFAAKQLAINAHDLRKKSAWI